MILPHGSYLLNLGAPNKDTLMKSREAFLDELQRCELLGLTMLNIHPGVKNLIYESFMRLPYYYPA